MSAGCALCSCSLQPLAVPSQHVLELVGPSFATEGGVNVSPERRAVSCRTLDYQCSVSAAESALISTVVACFIG